MTILIIASSFLAGMTTTALIYLWDGVAKRMEKWEENHSKTIEKEQP